MGGAGDVQAIQPRRRRHRRAGDVLLRHHPSAGALRRHHLRAERRLRAPRRGAVRGRARLVHHVLGGQPAAVALGLPRRRSTRRGRRRDRARGSGQEGRGIGRRRLRQLGRARRAASRVRRARRLAARFHVRARLLGLGDVARAARHHLAGDVGARPVPVRAAGRGRAAHGPGDGVHVALLGRGVGRPRGGGVRGRATRPRRVDRRVCGARAARESREGGKARRRRRVDPLSLDPLPRRRCANGRATAPTSTSAA